MIYFIYFFIFFINPVHWVRAFLEGFYMSFEKRLMDPIIPKVLVLMDLTIPYELNDNRLIEISSILRR